MNSDCSNKTKSSSSYYRTESCTKLNYVYTARQCDQYLNFLEELRTIIHGKKESMSPAVASRRGHSIHYHTKNGKTLTYQLENVANYGISLSALSSETETIITETAFSEPHVAPPVERAIPLPLAHLPSQIEERMLCCLRSSKEVITSDEKDYYFPSTPKNYNIRNVNGNSLSSQNNPDVLREQRKRLYDNTDKRSTSFEQEYSEDVSAYKETDRLDELVNEEFAVMEEFATVLEESESVFEECNDHTEDLDDYVVTDEDVVQTLKSNQLLKVIADDSWEHPHTSYREVASSETGSTGILCEHYGQWTNGKMDNVHSQRNHAVFKIISRTELVEEPDKRETIQEGRMNGGCTVHTNRELQPYLKMDERNSDDVIQSTCCEKETVEEPCLPDDQPSVDDGKTGKWSDDVTFDTITTSERERTQNSAGLSDAQVFVDDDYIEEKHDGSDILINSYQLTNRHETHVDNTFANGSTEDELSTPSSTDENAFVDSELPQTDCGHDETFETSSRKNSADTREEITETSKLNNPIEECLAILDKITVAISQSEDLLREEDFEAARENENDCSRAPSLLGSQYLESCTSSESTNVHGESELFPNDHELMDLVRNYVNLVINTSKETTSEDIESVTPMDTCSNHVNTSKLLTDNTRHAAMFMTRVSTKKSDESTESEDAVEKCWLSETANENEGLNPETAEAKTKCPFSESLIVTPGTVESCSSNSMSVENGDFSVDVQRDNVELSSIDTREEDCNRSNSSEDTVETIIFTQRFTDDQKSVVNDGRNKNSDFVQEERNDIAQEVSNWSHLSSNKVLSTNLEQERKSHEQNSNSNPLCSVDRNFSEKMGEREHFGKNQLDESVANSSTDTEMSLLIEEMLAELLESLTTESLPGRENTNDFESEPLNASISSPLLPVDQVLRAEQLNQHSEDIKTIPENLCAEKRLHHDLTEHSSENAIHLETQGMEEKAENSENRSSDGDADNLENTEEPCLRHIKTDDCNSEFRSQDDTERANDELPIDYSTAVNAEETISDSPMQGSCIAQQGFFDDFTKSPSSVLESTLDAHQFCDSTSPGEDSSKTVGDSHYGGIEKCSVMNWTSETLRRESSESPTSSKSSRDHEEMGIVFPESGTTGQNFEDMESQYREPSDFSLDFPIHPTNSQLCNETVTTIDQSDVPLETEGVDTTTLDFEENISGTVPLELERESIIAETTHDVDATTVAVELDEQKNRVRMEAYCETDEMKDRISDQLEEAEEPSIGTLRVDNKNGVDDATCFENEPCPSNLSSVDSELSSINNSVLKDRRCPEKTNTQETEDNICSEEMIEDSASKPSSPTLHKFNEMIGDEHEEIQCKTTELMVLENESMKTDNVDESSTAPFPLSILAFKQVIDMHSRQSDVDVFSTVIQEDQTSIEENTEEHLFGFTSKTPTSTETTNETFDDWCISRTASKVEDNHVDHNFAVGANVSGFVDEGLLNTSQSDEDFFTVSESPADVGFSTELLEKNNDQQCQADELNFTALEMFSTSLTSQIMDSVMNWIELEIVDDITRGTELKSERSPELNQYITELVNSLPDQNEAELDTRWTRDTHDEPNLENVKMENNSSASAVPQFSSPAYCHVGNFVLEADQTDAQPASFALSETLDSNVGTFGDNVADTANCDDADNEDVGFLGLLSNCEEPRNIINEQSGNLGKEGSDAPMAQNIEEPKMDADDELKELPREPQPIFDPLETEPICQVEDGDKLCFETDSLLDNNVENVQLPEQSQDKDVDLDADQTDAQLVSFASSETLVSNVGTSGDNVDTKTCDDVDNESVGLLSLLTNSEEPRSIINEQFGNLGNEGSDAPMAQNIEEFKMDYKLKELPRESQQISDTLETEPTCQVEDGDTSCFEIDYLLDNNVEDIQLPEPRQEKVDLDVDKIDAQPVSYTLSETLDSIVGTFSDNVADTSNCDDVDNESVGFCSLLTKQPREITDEQLCKLGEGESDAPMTENIEERKTHADDELKELPRESQLISDTLETEPTCQVEDGDTSCFEIDYLLDNNVKDVQLPEQSHDEGVHLDEDQIDGQPVPYASSETLDINVGTFGDNVDTETCDIVDNEGVGSFGLLSNCEEQRNISNKQFDNFGEKEPDAPMTENVEELKMHADDELKKLQRESQSLSDSLKTEPTCQIEDGDVICSEIHSSLDNNVENVQLPEQTHDNEVDLDADQIDAQPVSYALSETLDSNVRTFADNVADTEQCDDVDNEMVGFVSLLSNCEKPRSIINEQLVNNGKKELDAPMAQNIEERKMDADDELKELPIVSQPMSDSLENDPTNQIEDGDTLCFETDSLLDYNVKNVMLAEQSYDEGVHLDADLGATRDAEKTKCRVSVCSEPDENQTFTHVPPIPTCGEAFSKCSTELDKTVSSLPKQEDVLVGPPVHTIALEHSESSPPAFFQETDQHGTVFDQNQTSESLNENCDTEKNFHLQKDSLSTIPEETSNCIPTSFDETKQVEYQVMQSCREHSCQVENQIRCSSPALPDTWSCEVHNVEAPATSEAIELVSILDIDQNHHDSEESNELQTTLSDSEEKVVSSTSSRHQVASENPQTHQVSLSPVMSLDEETAQEYSHEAFFIPPPENSENSSPESKQTTASVDDNARWAEQLLEMKKQNYENNLVCQIASASEVSTPDSFFLSPTSTENTVNSSLDPSLEVAPTGSSFNHSEPPETSSVVEEVSYLLTTVCVAALALVSPSESSSSFFNSAIVEDASKYFSSDPTSEDNNDQV